MKAKPDFIIGKDAMVRFDAGRLLQVSPLADLTDRTRGTTHSWRAFIVRTNDPAKRLADLSGRAVMLGPEEEAETNQAAQAALQQARLAKPAKLDVAGAVDSSALALTDGEVAAAVVPEYLPQLLIGCEKVEAGSVRVLAKTKPVPGVRLFRTDTADDALAKRVLAEVTGLANRKELLVALESAKGFVKSLGQAAWLDWRGLNRLGQAPTLPSQLPEELKKIWSTKLTGPAVAGPAATVKRVIIPDKSAAARTICFAALTLPTAARCGGWSTRRIVNWTTAIRPARRSFTTDWSICTAHWVTCTASDSIPARWFGERIITANTVASCWHGARVRRR